MVTFKESPQSLCLSVVFGVLVVKFRITTSGSRSLKTTSKDGAALNRAKYTFAGKNMLESIDKAFMEHSPTEAIHQMRRVFNNAKEYSDLYIS